ncbi:Uu.00g118350.m01.CDS01 [Anthostomella pinea]|uniref:Uu.00g118350.m01.CDS01 n=1 Tax=Anthostomella pinea TaxID=933095 RepID=A0AAI8YH14_9PEZI|nr:Uu.00g118350.m01.CDS01 [Anthostomella pinea]
MEGGAMFDVLIIGGGFSGLSVAATLARQSHTALIFDSGSYRNARSNHMHIMPTWDHKDPEQFRTTARSELEMYDTIQIRQVEVKGLRKTDEGLFEATDATGEVWRGRKVVLATGVEDQYPDIQGYDECWARAIYHCLFCHGYEQRGAESAGILAVDLIASAQKARQMARMASSLVRSVTIYTNANKGLAEQIAAALQGFEHYCVDDRAISKLSLTAGSDQSVKISFKDGSEEKREAFLVHSPITRAKGPFAQQLGLELTPTGDYAVLPPFNATSVNGVYAVGDCMTMFKVATNAVASGSMTGAGVSGKLHEEQEQQD